MSSYYPQSTDYGDEAYTPDRGTYPQTHQSFSPNAEIAIFEPTSFEEMPEALHALRLRRMVVLNLIRMDHEEAQRSIDFMAGGTFIFNGSLEQIDPKIFLFAPHSTEISFESPTGQQNSQDIGQTFQESYPNFAFRRESILDQSTLRHKAS